MLVALDLVAVGVDKITIASSPWQFGWEALVAIGTIGLALATALLALSTRRVARETREVASATEAEILASSRPVLLVQQLAQDSEGHLRPAIRLTDEVATILVTNCGRGPALDVHAELSLPDLRQGSLNESRLLRALQRPSTGNQMMVRRGRGLTREHRGWGD